jgi:hypothetical protein
MGNRQGREKHPERLRVGDRRSGMGVHQHRDLGGASVSTGDPFRVDVPTNLHPRVLRTTRLLSGDRVAVRGNKNVLCIVQHEQCMYGLILQT